MNIEIKSYNFDLDEVLALYESVGWSAYTSAPEKLEPAFKNSLLTLGAYGGEELLGIIRAVGDGVTVVFIQDILVFPKFQRMGVGKALVEALLNKFPEVRQIELATDDTPETKGFYKSLGFAEMSECGCLGFMK